MEHADLSGIMKEKAEAVQAFVTNVKTFDEVICYTVRITKRQGGKSVAAPCLDPAGKKALIEMCDSEGLILIDPLFGNTYGKIDTALTHADLGVAETGTLIINSRSEDLRRATMLSEIHVAYLDESQIRPDMDSVKDEIGKIIKNPPAYLAFITGASRTADIERVLTIGVHGPLELHILIMENPLS
jgi:L-lactate dehydrogenase complex protein LldG